MVVSKRPVREILEAIRSRNVSFDVSEEIEAELRIAGVPEEVIQAMRERQAQMNPPAPTQAPSSIPEGTASILVTFKPQLLWFPGRAEEGMARDLQLGSSPEDRAIKDIAVFLACVVPDHVPDHWRSQSPLGRDFVSMPRHEMLAFQAGAARVGPEEVPRAVRAALCPPRADEAAAGWLRLELPRELVATIEPGLEHDLLLGVAVLVGDRYLKVGETRKLHVVASGPGLDLPAKVVQGKAARNVVDLEFLEGGVTH